MPTSVQRYRRPATLDEAWRLFAEEEGAAFVAGGTDLLVQARAGRRAPRALISLCRIDELRGIREEGGRLVLGGGTAVQELLSHPAVRRHAPALADAAATLGSRQIRSVATVAGNLCNASPAADLAVPLLVLDAAVECRSPAGRRTVALADFFLGPGRTALAPGEIAAAVSFAVPDPATRMAFLRRGRVRMDLAQASLALLWRPQAPPGARVRLAAGAVAPTPLRLCAAEAVLEAAAALILCDDETLARAVRAAAAEIAPISDLRASADYRRRLIGVFLRRAWQAVTA